MTKLTQRKTKLQFETEGSYRGRPIIIEAGPHVATVRLKGTRKRYELSWDSVFNRAVLLAAEQLRAQRKLQRKGQGRTK